MKGISIFSDLFTTFMLIIVVIFMCALIWIFTEIYVLGSMFGAIQPREATVRVLYSPVKYESALLTFLELRHQGIKMKKILNAVAIQNTTDVWIPEIGDFVDSSQVSEDFLDQIFVGDIYLLKIRDPEIIICSSGKSNYWQKTSTELFLLNGKPIDLELYVI